MLSFSDEKSPVLPYLPQEVSYLILDSLFERGEDYNRIILKNVNKFYYRKYPIIRQIDYDDLREVVTKGYCSVLKWYYDMGYDRWIKIHGKCISAENGHMNIIDWLLKIGCKIDKYFIRYASRGGQLDIIKRYIDERHPIDNRACYNAVLGGHLDALKLLISKGYPIQNKIVEISGRPHIIKWLTDNYVRGYGGYLIAK